MNKRRERPAARDKRLAQGGRSTSGTRPLLVALAVAAAVLVLAWLLAPAARAWGTRNPILLAYLGLSATTFVAYALDKRAAMTGQWRISENTLHLLALAGGWPGAMLGQRLLRHKTSKRSFLRVYWLTVLLNLALLAAWQAGWLP